ncbi:uncharacterized protein UBRO2_03777 [Ustilago bromivora]|uniref:Uncharacterized protein n=1 Tax=Ustilago bromivora TaxID=307758 RepID=A0A8H8QND7_9BASI|nr:uncharacterized protein UBRO2_03777 [Ustilago bromivora]
MKEAFSTPLQGYDALRILTQILSLQTLHYLILATLLPPFLAIFAETSSLMFEGGPTQVGMVFDWRQVASRPTYDWLPPKDILDQREGWKGWIDPGPGDGDGGEGGGGEGDGVEGDEGEGDGGEGDEGEGDGGEGNGGEVEIDPAVLVRWNLDNVWLDAPLPGSSGVQGRVLDHEQILRYKSSNLTTTSSDPNPSSPSSESEMSTQSPTVESAIEHWEWDHTRDSHRSYVLIVTWLLTAPLDILLLVYLVRRPTHMLDHALTLHFLNLLITSLYVGRVPSSLVWWLTMLVHAAVTIVWSEQLAIKREMGRSLGYSLVANMGDMRKRVSFSLIKHKEGNIVLDEAKTNSPPPTQAVLFDSEPRTPIPSSHQAE